MLLYLYFTGLLLMLESFFAVGNVSCVHRAVWLSIFVSPKQTIPYLGPIYGGLREGVSIYIQGSVPEDITRSV